MRYLLDTNVLSELRKRSGDPGVKEWVAAHRPADLAISVVTVIEIETGILQIDRRDPSQGSQLRRWFEGHVLKGFSGRILPLDLEAARRVASLHVPDRAPERDALIAATAMSRGLSVVTRNVSDFERTGVALVNPWS